MRRRSPPRRAAAGPATRTRASRPWSSPGVILPQDLEHLGARELARHDASFRERLAQLRARDLQPIGVGVRAGAARGHAAARIAIEGEVELERLDLERPGRDLVEDAVRVEGAVVAAHAG